MPSRLGSLRRLAIVASAVALAIVAWPLVTSRGHAPLPAAQVQGAVEPAAPSPSGRVASPAEPHRGGTALAWIGERPEPRPLWALTGYQWPLPHGRVTQPFGPSRGGSRLVDGVEFHDGVDLATFCGDRIVAAHDGVVLRAGRHYDESMGWRGDLAPYFAWLDQHSGWSTLPIVVVIDDGNDYRSIYGHLSRVVVAPGEVVRAGQLIGYEGRTGIATGCHLHYSLFSPLEPTAWQVAPDLVARYSLPALETARVNPLLVFPPRPLPAPPDSLAADGRPAVIGPGPAPE